MQFLESPQDRVDEALARLSSEAQNVSRESRQGQLIEALGCILSGRKGGWWPNDKGQAPAVIDAYNPPTHSWVRLG